MSTRHFIILRPQRLSGVLINPRLLQAYKSLHSTLVISKMTIAHLPRFHSYRYYVRDLFQCSLVTYTLAFSRIPDNE